MDSPPAPENSPSYLALDGAHAVPIAPPSEPYALSSILYSARTATAADLATAPSRIAASPCLRPALVWSAAIGGLLGLHRRRLGGALLRCAVDGYLGAGFTMCWSWYACRRLERDKALTMNAYYASLQERGGGGGAAQQGAAAPPPGGEQEEWRKALDKLAPQRG